MQRKTIALSALILFFTLPAAAQTPGFSEIGIKGGVDFATLRTDDEGPNEEVGYKTGFVIGFYGQIPTADDFLTIQPEFLYVRKGATLESGDTAIDINLDYIEVPVLLKANLPVQTRFFPSLYAGPYAAFAINRSVSDDDGEADIEEGFKSTDFGLVLGGDFDVTFGGYAFNLGGRYELGLTDVSQEDAFSNSDFKTGTFLITLGFAI